MERSWKRTTRVVCGLTGSRILPAWLSDESRLALDLLRTYLAVPTA
jgi:hypothetical protein